MLDGERRNIQDKSVWLNHHSHSSSSLNFLWVLWTLWCQRYGGLARVNSV